MTGVKTGRGGARVYLILFSIAGICLSVFVLSNYFRKAVFNANIIFQIAVLTAALTVCRSLTLPTRKGQGVDISIVILYATMLLMGPGVTIVSIIISAFFTVVKWDDRKVGHIFNTPVTKTLFNNFNLILSVFLGYLAFSAFGGSVGNLKFPAILLPSFFFLITAFVANSICMFLLLKLKNGIPFFPSLLSGIASMLPTLLSFTPIGLFLALIFQLKDGPYLAMLFFVPLLFARYAFKLYIDSKEQYLRTISTLTAAIEAKDEYTQGHSKRVAQFAVDIAQAMRLSALRIENIKVASVLHDIGKIGINDVILRKPGKLAPDEWDRIIQHPSIGVKILEEVSMPDPVKEIILYHHVRYDKTGYPRIDKNRQISMEVHIVSLADAYDAMTSDRPYRLALTADEALGIIRRERGTQFHPVVVDVFMKIMHRNEQAAK